MTAPTGARDRGRAAALRLGRWSVVALALASAVGVAAFGWPLLVAPDAGLAHASDAPLVLGLVVAGVLLVVHLALADGGMDVKAVALLGLLAAVGAALRPLSAGAAGVELVFTVLVLGGRVLGPGFGFALGATTLATSALLTGGVGPWLPFQMLGAAWVGLGAGLLPRRPRGPAELVMLAGYGALAALAFGLAMNLSFWPYTLGSDTALSFVPGAPLGDNLRRLMAFTVATSLGWDVGRAVTTAVGVALVGAPVLRLLRRTAARAAFVPAVFAGPTDRVADPSTGRRDERRAGLDTERPSTGQPLPR